MKRVEYIIDELEMILNNTASLKLKPKNKDKAVQFHPGQYGLISFLKGKILSEERPFSFASSTLHPESLEFGFRVVGKFTTEASKLKKGDTVFVRGPFGGFIYDEKKYPDTVFLAAGIGITPFLSAFRYAAEKKLPNKMTLLYSNNVATEIPFYEELKRLEAINDKFKTYHLITNPSETMDKNSFIAGRICKPVILQAINNDINFKTFFLCGPTPYMEAAIGMLKELGVKDENIITEGFSQIPLSFFEKGTGIFPLVAGTSALITLAAFLSINQMEMTNAALRAEAQKLSTPAQSISTSLGSSMTITETPTPTPAITSPTTSTKTQATTVKKTTRTTTIPKATTSTATAPTPTYVAPTPSYTPPTTSPTAPPQTRMS